MKTNIVLVPAVIEQTGVPALRVAFTVSVIVFLLAGESGDASAGFSSTSLEGTETTSSEATPERKAKLLPTATSNCASRTRNGIDRKLRVLLR